MWKSGLDLTDTVKGDLDFFLRLFFNLSPLIQRFKSKSMNLYPQNDTI